jgi:hypothetical protein
MNALELVEIGDSLGLIFSDEILQRLKVVAGDTLFLTETLQGFTLTTVDPQTAGAGVTEPTQAQVENPVPPQNKK